jgi:hypothetical protein
MSKNKEEVVDLKPSSDSNEAEKQNLIHNNELYFQKLNNAFKTYSRNKTYAAGLLDMALITTNFTQIKNLINHKQSEMPFLNILLLSFVALSVILQVSIGIVLIFSTKNVGFAYELERKKILNINNLITVIALIITIINIFVNVFMITP